MLLIATLIYFNSFNPNLLSIILDPETQYMFTITNNLYFPAILQTEFYLLVPDNTKPVAFFSNTQKQTRNSRR